MTRTTQEEQSIVAIRGSLGGAEIAVQALQQAGVDVKRLSIVGKDFLAEDHALGIHTLGDRMRFWDGAAWFGAPALWGMLFGGSFFTIPAIGPLLVMGPLTESIAGAFEGPSATRPAAVLTTALTSLGIPADSVERYEREVKSGKFLVVAHGSAEVIERARAALESTGFSQPAAQVRAKPEIRERGHAIQPANPAA
jgi:hypothetical protein